MSIIVLTLVASVQALHLHDPSGTFHSGGVAGSSSDAMSSLMAERTQLKSENNALNEIKQRILQFTTFEDESMAETMMGEGEGGDDSAKLPKQAGGSTDDNSDDEEEVVVEEDVEVTNNNPVQVKDTGKEEVEVKDTGKEVVVEGKGAEAMDGAIQNAKGFLGNTGELIVQGAQAGLGILGDVMTSMVSDKKPEKEVVSDKKPEKDVLDNQEEHLQQEAGSHQENSAMKTSD